MSRWPLPSLSILLAACADSAVPPLVDVSPGTDPVGAVRLFGDVEGSGTPGLVGELDAAGFRGRVRFEGGGAVLTAGGQEIALATKQWGREAALVVRKPAPAIVGDCVFGNTGGDTSCLARAEMRGDGLVEWWVSDPRGLEQGWTVSAPPSGVGPLILALTVDGAEVSIAERGETATFDADGVRVECGALVAIDAHGRTLPASLEALPGGFAVRVDDREAAYPITIDPLYTTATWDIAGGATSARLGSAVASAGDVNGDGYDDLIVGAYTYSSNAGRVYVYYGNASGVSTTADATLSESSSQYFGISVAGAGDVNGDGYDDVIVGESGYSSSRGRAWIYHGSAAGLSTTSTTSISGGTSYELGRAVAGAGDVNGDGYDDVIVGAPGYSSSRGLAYIHHGSSSGVSSTADRALIGTSSSDYFGYAVDSAGDTNGDGYDDVIVGEYGYSSGRAYLYEGSASGIPSTAEVTLSSPSSSSDFGTAVAGVGDVNGDGYDDVIVGGPGYSSDTGRAWVFRGSSSGLSSSSSTTLSGSASSNYFGYAVAGAGDVDADGYDDVVVGAYGYTSSLGRAYVYKGSGSGVSSTVDTTLTGTLSGGAFGIAVAGAGDTNGDGHGEVLVGASGTDGSYTNEGSAWLFPASLTLESPDGGETWAGSSTQTISWLGWGVADATQIDLDYSTDSGTTWTSITTGLGTTATSYSWTVPSLNSSDVRVRVVLQSPSGDVTDSSDSDFTVDSTAPTTFDLTSPTNGAYGGPEQTFDWSEATGERSYALWIDGVEVASGFTASTYTLDSTEALAAGAHVWYVVAADTAGNERQSTSTWTVVVEDTPPAAFSLVGPADGDWQSEAVTFEWTASSDAESGLSSYTLYVDGTACETGISATATSIDFADLSCEVEDGTHTWSVVAVDAVGNETTADPSAGWSFGLDTLAPTELGTWTGKVDANDIGPDDGVSTGLTVSVGDRVVSSASGHWSFRTSCSTSSYYDADGAGYTWPYSTTTSCSYLSLIGRIGTGSWLCIGSSDSRIATSAGELEFASNDDDADNCATLALTVVATVLDVWEPTSPTDKEWVDTNLPTFEWPEPTESGSGIASYTLVIDGRDFATGITSTSYTVTSALSEGDHDWSVVAVDAVGNEGESEEFTVNIDSEPPLAFSLDSPSDSDCSSLLTPTLCWEAATDVESGVEEYDLYVDGALSTTVTSSSTCTSVLLSAGVHNWYVVARDEVGHETSSTETFTLSVGSSSTEVCDGVDNDCDGDFYGSTTDEISGGSVASGTNRLRGNKVYVSAPTSLVSLQAYLSVSAGTELTWSVYEGTSETGTFTLVANTTREEVTGSLGWKSSGPLPWVLEENTWYVFAVSWATSTSHYAESGASLPEVISFGDVYGGVEASGATPAASASFTTKTYTVDMRFVTGGESDADGDGSLACDGDCDDTDATIYTGAAEACDGIDEDCDGLVPADEQDADGDGMSTCAGDCDDSLVTVYLGAAEVCDRLDGDCDGVLPADEQDADSDSYAACEGDCDDTNGTASPAGVEVVADGVDQDCDGVDSCYADDDGDGFGTSTVVDGSSVDCLTGTGATIATDCDDTVVTTNPGGTEVCDALDADEDCDGVADNHDPSATGKATYYVDGDGDGYGSASTGAWCDAPAGWSEVSTDCDDADAAWHPGAPESDCTDPNDYNCDGSVAYDDQDGDGHPACTDCDDADSAFHPGASESDCMDPNDYNCDGSVGYTDADADGYAACAECDDAAAEVNPGAEEEPGDEVDGDCDGAETCFVDEDGDGYRPDEGTTASADVACDGDGEASRDTPVGDCDDEDPSFNPGADEPDCTDPTDYNCDGSVGYADLDADGFAACVECDDTTAEVNPAATEVCNGLDDDCDGTIDVGAVDATTWYADGDRDGYTDPALTTTACEPPEGYAAEGEPDCDDGDAEIWPGAVETPGDGVDQDCDGVDPGAPADDSGGSAKSGAGACGCASTEGPAFGAIVVALALVARRRGGGFQGRSRAVETLERSP